METNPLENFYRAKERLDILVKLNQNIDSRSKVIWKRRQALILRFQSTPRKSFGLSNMIQEIDDLLNMKNDQFRDDKFFKPFYGHIIDSLESAEANNPIIYPEAAHVWEDTKPYDRISKLISQQELLMPQRAAYLDRTEAALAKIKELLDSLG